MISEATVIWKPSSRGTPCIRPPRPLTMWRSWRSFISTARFQVRDFFKLCVNLLSGVK